MRLIRIGEMRGGLSERVQRIERTWREAFNVKAFADIDLMIWEKFLCNVTLSAATAAFDVTVGELVANPESWAVAIGCMLEAWQVGQAQGVRFGFDDPVRYVTEFAATIPDASPSMRLDQLARRRSEVDVINGAVVDLSRELGLTAPYNETLSRSCTDASPASTDPPTWSHCDRSQARNSSGHWSQGRPVCDMPNP